MDPQEDPQERTRERVRRAALNAGLIKKDDDDAAFYAAVDAYSRFLSERARVDHREVRELWGALREQLQES